MVKITPLTGRAVLFVFSHRRQLDFGSVLGSNGQIMLPDDVILHVLHAHVRAEAITDFPNRLPFSTPSPHYIPSSNLQILK